MKYLPLTLLFLFCLSACRHDPPELTFSCVDQYIQDHQLIKYTGQELGCNFYVRVYTLDGKEYFGEDNPCADMIAIPSDCEGQPYCTSADDPALQYFYQHAEAKNIIGIKP